MNKKFPKRQIKTENSKKSQKTGEYCDAYMFKKFSG